jgi:disulfide bond formation protein DsbB
VPAARLLPLVLLAVSVLVVGAALVSQHVGGLQPCPLCLYQRWPWYATIALSLLAVLAAGRRGAHLVLALCGVLLAAGALLALYHVGVEAGVLQGPSACSGAAAADTVEALRAQIMGTAPVRCDEVAWSFLGVSMAGWNALASIAAAGFAFWGFRRLRAEAAA